MSIDIAAIKVGDRVVFESDHIRCEATVRELEMNLGQLWLHLDNPEGFHSIPLKGCKHHSIPAVRVVEHYPAIVITARRPPRTRVRPRA